MKYIFFTTSILVDNIVVDEMQLLYYVYISVFFCHSEQVARASSQDEVPRKKRKLVQDTKKVDCPASVYLVQILRFTKHSQEVCFLGAARYSEGLLFRTQKFCIPGGLLI